MKPGSLIEYVPTGTLVSTAYIRVIEMPQVGTPYTCRLIEKCDCGCSSTILMVEEICFGINLTTYNEIGIDISQWRELETPPALEDEISESLTRPAPVKKIEEELLTV